MFDAESLELVADIPATWGDGDKRSKVVGLVDAPQHRFVFSLWEAGEIWVLDMSDREAPAVSKFTGCGPKSL